MSLYLFQIKLTSLKFNYLISFFLATRPKKIYDFLKPEHFIYLNLNLILTRRVSNNTSHTLQ